MESAGQGDFREGCEFGAIRSVTGVDRLAAHVLPVERPWFIQMTKSNLPNQPSPVCFMSRSRVS